MVIRKALNYLEDPFSILFKQATQKTSVPNEKLVQGIWYLSVFWIDFCSRPIYLDRMALVLGLEISPSNKVREALDWLY